MENINKPLTKSEIYRLVTFIHSDHGSDLNENQFSECLLLLMEDIPLEMGPHNESQLIDVAYAMYRELINPK